MMNQMAMSNLTNKWIPVSNYSSRDGNTICKITPHHMAGNLSIEACGNVLENRGVSANYGIGSDGRIACYVDETDRSWASYSYSNDSQAITIEVADDEYGGDWHVSDTALEALINLCVDICQRYGFRLNYDGTPDGSLTRHNMFIETDCPGAYLQSKFPYIAEEVNRRLDGGQPTPPSPSGDTTGLITYQTYDNNRGIWLPEVYGSSDYAGIYGDNVGCVRARPELGEINIQVHTLNGTWLPYVNSNNYYDGGDNSYAGIYGVAIDGVRCYSTQGYVSYRVHLKGGDWLPWVTKADDTSDGYAGIYGYEIDAIQMY